jgi:hypothetical protein
VKELRDHPCHKPNNDGPKNTHSSLPLSCVLALCESKDHSGSFETRLVNRSFD